MKIRQLFESPHRIKDKEFQRDIEDALKVIRAYKKSVSPEEWDEWSFSKLFLVNADLQKIYRRNRYMRDNDDWFRSLEYRMQVERLLGKRMM